MSPELQSAHLPANQIRCTQRYWTTQAVNKIKHKLKGGGKVKKIYSLFGKPIKKAEKRNFRGNNFQRGRIEMGEKAKSSTGKRDKSSRNKHDGGKNTARNRAFTEKRFPVPDVAPRPLLAPFSNTLSAGT